MNFPIPFASFVKSFFSPKSSSDQTQSVDLQENIVESNHSSVKVKCHSPNMFMPTPFTPSSLFATKRHSSSERRWPRSTPGGYGQHTNSQISFMLPTPMILSSLDSLCSGPTVGDAFPDILQLVDQEGYSQSLYNSEPVPTSRDTDSQITSDQVPNNDSEFVDLLMTVADQIESDKYRPNKGSFTYTRPQDELQSRKSGQRKCRHAKRMTNEEEDYIRRCRQEHNVTGQRKSKRKVNTKRIRRSSRIKRSVQYYGCK